MSTAVQVESPAQELVRGMVISRARILTTSIGAIATGAAYQKGLTVTKTAAKTGRYTIQMVDGAGASVALSRVMEIRVTVISPTADSAITTDKAVDYTIRTVSEANGTFYLQFLKQLTSSTSVTYVDAELEDTAIFTIAVVSERNSVSV